VTFHPRPCAGCTAGCAARKSSVSSPATSFSIASAGGAEFEDDFSLLKISFA
jgi:hypothetical protein